MARNVNLTVQIDVRQTPIGQTLTKLLIISSRVLPTDFVAELILLVANHSFQYRIGSRRWEKLHGRFTFEESEETTCSKK